jgi:hypothetical protein
VSKKIIESRSWRIGRGSNSKVCLNSQYLLKSLHLIKDDCGETLTKNNLQTLIDQIYQLELDI